MGLGICRPCGRPLVGEQLGKQRRLSLQPGKVQQLLEQFGDHGETDVDRSSNSGDGGVIRPIPEGVGMFGHLVVLGLQVVPHGHCARKRVSSLLATNRENFIHFIHQS